MAKAPDFKTVSEEAEFWESQDSIETWAKAPVEVDLLRNLLYPKLVVLAYRPAFCPRCHSALADIVIEYVAADGDHQKNNAQLKSGNPLLVIRDVPALRCQANGHQYILEETFDSVERLLKLEKFDKLRPMAMLSVPVFSLKAVA